MKKSEGAKRQRKVNVKVKRIVMILLVLVIAGIFLLFKNRKVPVITIMAKANEMIEEEGFPAFEVNVEYENDINLNRVLDKKKNYTIKKLIEGIRKGNGYIIKPSSDGKKEGKFPLDIELTKELKQKLKTDWAGKIDIQTVASTLKVKNKVGEWDGEKFKRTDGSYIVSEWLEFKENKYYLNDEGTKSIGVQEIESKKYYFDKAGVMQKGWITHDGKNHLFNEDGSMALGWVTYKSNKYYFRRTGEMVTGKQQIGTMRCVFSNDGILQSEERFLDVTKPMLALTFDDGPGEETIILLNKLEEYGARATFFMVGNRIPRYADTIKKMLSIGCELGSHSTTHANLTKLDVPGIQHEINTTNAAISAIVGQGATLLRPPYGAVNDVVKETVGLPVIMWSVDTLDWQTRNVQATIESVMNASDGDVILLHDIHPETIQSALEFIPMLVDEGYQLVTVSELAAARGITLQNGERRGSFYKP